MPGKQITISASDGGKFGAYLALPESGKGPGLIVIQEIFGVNAHIRSVCDRYAAEGYVVLSPDLFWRIQPGVQLGYSGEDMQTAFGFYQKFDEGKALSDLFECVKSLRSMPECNGKVGALGFCLGGKLSFRLAGNCDIDAAVSYYGGGIDQILDEAKNIKCPIIFHYGELDNHIPLSGVIKVKQALSDQFDAEVFVYRGADHGFNCNERASYNPASALLARSRSLDLLRHAIGPRYDLNALWERHCELEFLVKDVDATMATMTSHPYVNHIPTMTGGVGQQELYSFYDEHFISRMPPDTKMTPISRTIGANRLIDEFVFCFTHTKEMDFMLPGVSPTGKYVEVPLVVIVNFRGDKISAEHIYWDQASVLVQVGLLKPAGLPVSGAEQARKALDETQPSNMLLKAPSK